MSNYVNEIINDLKTNPDTWVDNMGQGCKKQNVEINGFGNSKLLSVIYVEINTKRMPMSYIDCYKLELAVGWWYKTVSLKTLSK